MGKATIIWRGDSGSPRGHYAKSQVWDVSDSTALDTLASTLVSHTGCHLARTLYPTKTTINDVAPGAGVNVDRKAVIFIRDEADGKTFSQEYPAPVPADTETVPEGERLTSAAVAAITALIATATGKTLTGLWGKVVQGT